MIGKIKFLVVCCLISFTNTTFAQLKVNSNGYVGVNNSNPTRPLHVKGDTRIEGALFQTGYKAGSESVYMKIGAQRTANGIAGFDLTGDVNSYPVFGFRYVRKDNGQTFATHRGVQSFVFYAQEAADIDFFTDGTRRMQVSETGNIGIGTIGTVALDVNGDIKYTGSMMQSSDKRLKKNVKKFADRGLKEILKLKPISFQYNGKAGSKQDKVHVGLFAQDLKKVIPEFVSEFEWIDTDLEGKALNSETYLQINDSAIKYVLINAIQDQQVIIDDQQEMLSELKSLMNELESKLNKINALVADKIGNQDISVDLGDKLNTLEQNVPNPFNQETVIKYAINNEFKKASLVINTSMGELVKRIDIKQIGFGSIRLNNLGLRPGSYVYSLYVDGRVSETKKMIISSTP